MKTEEIKSLIKPKPVVDNINIKEYTWEEIDDSYQASIRQGIRMARQQATTNLFSIPVTGAEAAR